MSLSRIMKKRKIKRVVNRLVKYLVFGLLLFCVIYYFSSRKKSDERTALNPIYSASSVTTGMECPALLSSVEQGYYDYILQKKKTSQTIPIAFQHLFWDTLSVEFNFTYLPAQLPTASQKRGSNPVITANDPYHLTLRVKETCYLYLFQQTSSGELVRLFPNFRYALRTNPLTDSFLRIPEGVQWIYLDNTTGMENIILLASRWQQKKLESLVDSFAGRKDLPSGQDVIQKIKRYLDEQSKVAEKIPGLVFSEYTFYHQAMPKKVKGEFN